RWIHSSNIRPIQSTAISAASPEIITVAATTDNFNASQVVTADAEDAITPVAPIAEQETPLGKDDWRASSDPAATDRDPSTAAAAGPADATGFSQPRANIASQPGASTAPNTASSLPSAASPTPSPTNTSPQALAPLVPLAAG